MHGIKPRDCETSEQLDAYTKILRSALAIRKTSKTPSLEETEKVYKALQINPEEYTLWNFLREQIMRNISNPKITLDFWKDQFSLTEKAIYRHHKSYAAWQHRLWLLSEKLFSNISTLNECITEARKQEVLLCEKLLARDERNFHAWAHRIRILNVIEKINHDAELNFTEQMINRNFANYSAWHWRSVVLPKCIIKNQLNPDAECAKEFELTKQAFYTEPDVQSSWVYHRWLLGGAAARDYDWTPILNILEKDKLESELQACEDLLELESDAKWALQTKGHILSLLGRKRQAADVFALLIKIDPFRAGYYRDMQTKHETL